MGLFGLGHLGGLARLGRCLGGFLLLPPFPLLPEGEAPCCQAADQGQAGEQASDNWTALALVCFPPAQLLGLCFRLEVLKFDAPAIEIAALA